MTRGTVVDGHSIARAVQRRHHELAQRVSQLSEAEFDRPSTLPGWNRMRVLCHLRYGVEASHRISAATLAGDSSSFYPGGRDEDRPKSLDPRPGEGPFDVVESLRVGSDALDRLWLGLSAEDWTQTTAEPVGNADLGSLPLAHVALLRLTEVEVHGTDLDLGLQPWSDTFVDVALPFRLRWLAVRRSNHRMVENCDGTWILAATDGPSFAVALNQGVVSVEETDAKSAEALVASESPFCELEGTNGELLAFLLGRLPLERLVLRGDTTFASRFLAAFPAP